jgi:hypothetical protein
MFKHGDCKSKTYKSWDNMKQRCFNPKHKSYLFYGGKGVGIVSRWLSYPNFLADMGPRPLGMTLERDDRDKDYGPGNCRWATPKEQNENRSISVMLSFAGRTQTLGRVKRVFPSQLFTGDLRPAGQRSRS